MTTYFTDFGDGYSLGDLLAQGWTRRIGSSDPVIVEDAAASNGRAVDLDSTFNSHDFISWDLIDDDPDRDQAEVVMRVRIPSWSGSQRRVGAQVRGSENSGYYGYPGGSSDSGIARMDSGSHNNLASETDSGLNDTTDYFYLRFQCHTVNGDVDLKYRTWTGTVGDEPSAWNLETTDSSNEKITSVGNVGIKVYHFSDQFVDWIGVGTNGEAAPTEPVDSDSVVIGGVRVQTQIDSVSGSITAGVALESARTLLSLDARSGVVLTGVEIPVNVAGERVDLALSNSSGTVIVGEDIPVTVEAQRADLSLGSVTGETRTGLLTAGEAAQLAITSLPGGMVAGNAVSGVRVSMELTARHGLVITGDSIPVTILGDRASLSLSDTAGSVTSGIVLSGSATGLSIEPREGLFALGYNSNGTSVGLGLSPGDGVVKVGSLLKGATVGLSVIPRAPDLVRGQVVDGNAALMELLANPGELFQGLLLVTPIRKTAVIDISPKYNVIKLKT